MFIVPTHHCNLCMYSPHKRYTVLWWRISISISISISTCSPSWPHSQRSGSHGGMPRDLFSLLCVIRIIWVYSPLLPNKGNSVKNAPLRYYPGMSVPDGRRTAMRATPNVSRVRSIKCYNLEFSGVLQTSHRAPPRRCKTSWQRRYSVASRPNTVLENFLVST